ncbi:MAG: energy transducer TonB, partial [Bacteroidetes bacterium]|nr:energy transducer TonB [Bacteroidota bacterium]
LDEEAIRVVKLLDRFKPGMLSGKAIPIRYTLPVTFRIDTVHPDSRSVPHPSYR